MTAVQIAAERGVDAGILTALLDCGADAFAEIRGIDSFLLALVCGKQDNLAALLNHAGAEANLARDHWLTNALQRPDTNRTSVFDAYMSAIHGAGLVNVSDEEGHTLLFRAVARANQLLVPELLALGANPNAAGPFGWTPFHEAVRTGNTMLAKQLVNNGANALATATNVGPYSPRSKGLFHQDHGAPAINSLHIAAGADPDIRRLGVDNKTLFPGMVRLLLELGLDPNSKTKNTDKLGRLQLREAETPLDILFRRGGYEWDDKFFEVVRTLVDDGADVGGVLDRMGVWDVVKFEGHEDLWEVLRGAGSVPQEIEGRTPSGGADAV